MMEEPFRLALADACRAAQRLGLPVLLIGAFSRELILHGRRTERSRQTRDADVALIVESWSRFDEFLDACEGHFDLVRRELYMRHRATGVKIDTVPCGDIEAPPGAL